MLILIITACLAFTNIAFSLPQRNNHEEGRLQQNRGFASTLTSFRPTTISYNDFDDDDNSGASSQAVLARTPSYGEDNYPLRNSIAVVQQRPHPRPQQPQQFSKRPSSPPQQFRQQLEEEAKELGEKEKEEEEEPDRLSILLPQSKFECIGKTTGYYADEGLGCEVFHYCQDNAKHSWICPEGFTFHQVHLICMPPGNDNICEQSSKYFIVNDYLYKPVNLEEHQTKPNVSLRYSERFYPGQYNNYQQDYDDEEEVPQNRQPIRVALQQAPAPHSPRVVPVQRRPTPSPFSPTFRPDTTLGQVFRSPEEVNISLQQRRPPFVAQRYVSQEQREY